MQSQRTADIHHFARKYHIMKVGLMDNIDREVKYLEALENLPISEDTKWLMQYIRGVNGSLNSTNDWLRGVFIVLLAILVILLRVHWDAVFS